jgi:hypothetical protein
MIFDTDFLQTHDLWVHPRLTAIHCQHQNACRERNAAFSYTYRTLYVFNVSDAPFRRRFENTAGFGSADLSV